MISMTWPQYRRRQCAVDGRVVRLTRSECEVLSTLLLHRGRPVMPSQIIEAIYDPESEPDAAHNCVLKFVQGLRSKLPGLIRQHGPTCQRGMQGYVVNRA